MMQQEENLRKCPNCGEMKRLYPSFFHSGLCKCCVVKMGKNWNKKKVPKLAEGGIIYEKYAQAEIDCMKIPDRREKIIPLSQLSKYQRKSIYAEEMKPRVSGVELPPLWPLILAVMGIFTLVGWCVVSMIRSIGG